MNQDNTYTKKMEEYKLEMILLIFFCLLVTIFMYLVILGGSINKSNEEIERENKEQEKYLKDYDNKRRRRNKNGENLYK